MNRYGTVLVVLIVTLLIFAVAQPWADEPATGLPGAVPDVDAARYPSIQAAIDALPATGGIIRLPAGTFDISKPLIIWQQDVHFTGSGTGTRINNVNTAGEPAIAIHPKGVDKPSKDQRQWRIQLSNFRVIGNAKSGHGIEANGVNELFIHGVTVSYHGGDGIHMDHCYEDPRICDSLITYNKGTGLTLLGCHDIVVSSNQFEENQDGLHCFDGFNLCMTGNCLDDHLGHGVVIENTYGSVLSGNMIEECKGTAVILDRDCYGNTLSANVIAHDGAGIDLKDAHGCAVSANTFTIMGSDALRIRSGSGRITVTGNNFSNSYIGEGGVKRRKNDLLAAGLVLESTSDVTISGNLFSSVEPKAVSVSGKAQRILFANNTLTDTKSDHAKLEASLVEGNLETP